MIVENRAVSLRVEYDAGLVIVTADDDALLTLTTPVAMALADELTRAAEPKRVAA